MWLEEDQDAVLGYLRERRKVCPGCGVHEDDKPHVVPRIDQCVTCEQQQQATESIPEGEKGFRVTFEPLVVALARDAAGE